MSKVFTFEGKVIVNDKKVASNKDCCCERGECCVCQRYYVFKQPSPSGGTIAETEELAQKYVDELNADLEAAVEAMSDSLWQCPGYEPATFRMEVADGPGLGFLPVFTGGGPGLALPPPQNPVWLITTGSINGLCCDKVTGDIMSGFDWIGSCIERPSGEFWEVHSAPKCVKNTTPKECEQQCGTPIEDCLEAGKFWATDRGTGPTQGVINICASCSERPPCEWTSDPAGMWIYTGIISPNCAFDLDWAGNGPSTGCLCEHPDAVCGPAPTGFPEIQCSTNCIRIPDNANPDNPYNPLP
jgi:hypothetical protein